MILGPIPEFRTGMERSKIKKNRQELKLHKNCTTIKNSFLNSRVFVLCALSAYLFVINF